MVINVHQAKTHLSQLLERVEAGERIVLGRNGRPVARLIPYVTEREPRRPGALRGEIRIAGDFDDTPIELIEEFEGLSEG
ncbi:MAG: type II toxin-antitoxin system Phd/YefM family antitoxin [Microthrixaceae bacterium]|nr:type II toxin-antitoxin system Phd/YefM family antitoxin [Microthrixaceae bacterium]